MTQQPVRHLDRTLIQRTTRLALILHAAATHAQVPGEFVVGQLAQRGGVVTESAAGGELMLQSVKVGGRERLGSHAWCCGYALPQNLRRPRPSPHARLPKQHAATNYAANLASLLDPANLATLGCHWQKPIRFLRVAANNSREGGRERVRRESHVSKLLRRRDGRKVLPTWAQVPDS